MCYCICVCTSSYMYINILYTYIIKKERKTIIDSEKISNYREKRDFFIYIFLL